jgi:hypothetical protein
MSKQDSQNLCKLQKGCTRLAAASDKVDQLLAHGRWFSPGTPASSTTKTGRHDIAEILLKVALNTKNQAKPKSDKITIHQSYTLGSRYIQLRYQYLFHGPVVHFLHYCDFRVKKRCSIILCFHLFC